MIAVATELQRDRQSVLTVINPSTGGRAGAVNRSVQFFGRRITDSPRSARSRQDRTRAAASASCCRCGSPPRTLLSQRHAAAAREHERGRAGARRRWRSAAAPAGFTVEDAPTRPAGFHVSPHFAFNRREKAAIRGGRRRRPAASGSASTTSRATSGGWSGRCGDPVDAPSAGRRAVHGSPSPSPLPYPPPGLDAAAVRALGGLARLAGGLRDRPPLPPPAPALRAAQRQPPLGPGAGPRAGVAGWIPYRSLSCLSCAARPTTTRRHRRLPRAATTPPSGGSTSATTDGAQRYARQGARPQLRARRGRRAGGRCCARAARCGATTATSSCSRGCSG